MIFPSITSTARNHLETIKEAKEYKIKAICLFVTCLSPEERKKVYLLLEETEIVSIPLVHIKDDTELWEMDYLSSRFSTIAFNCHSSKSFSLKNDVSAFNDKIFIENAGVPMNEDEVKTFAGVCLDFSHLKMEYCLAKDRYENDVRIIDKYPIGCAHVSAFSKMRLETVRTNKDTLHRLKEYSDVDYLEEYQKFFPEIMALELENSLEEQLKIIDYLSSKSWIRNQTINKTVISKVPFYI